ncbi:BRCA1-associated RING domain protein 1 [Sparganum proliferum]
MPFTTGVCSHTLCETCCSPSKQPKKTGGVCPVCKVPIRPCDVKPHPQLSSLVVVTRRLAKLLRRPFDADQLDADFIDQSPRPQGRTPLKDNLDFLNSDTYCRVDSPSPSPESSNNLESTSLKHILAVSPVACSIQAKPEPTVLLRPSDRAEADLAGAQTTVRCSPSPAKATTTPPSRTRRPARRKLGDSSDSRASPEPSFKLPRTAKAPFAVPEDSYITEDSLLSSARRQKSTSDVDRLKSKTESTSSFVEKRTNLRKAKSTGAAKTKTKRSTVTDSSSTHHLRLNSKGESVVHRAAIRNDVDQLQTLLSSGLSANVRDHAGWTPLHEAALRGHTEAANCLLRAGASVDLPGGPDLETPLHDAVTNAHLLCCKLLLKHGANPEAPNALGLSPLDVCANMLERLKRQAKPMESKRAKSDTVVKTVLMDINKALLEARDRRSAGVTVPETGCKVSGGQSSTSPRNALAPVDPMATALFIERRRLRPVLLGTGLSRIQRTQFVRVASLLHARVATEMSPEVTHLITGATLSPQSDKQKKKPSMYKDSVYPNESNCPRTLKFLSAVLQGCWVLAFDWIETCSLVKSRVEEEGFELPGCSTAPTTYAPRKARQAREAGSAGLFHGFRLCLLGTFVYPTPTRGDLVSLAQAGGATVFSRDISSPRRLASLTVEEPTSDWVLAEASADAVAFFTTECTVHPSQLLAIYDPRATDGSSTTTASPTAMENLPPDRLVAAALALLRSKKVLSRSGEPPPIAPIRLLPATWIMDCVADYSILPAPANPLSV